MKTEEILERRSGIPRRTFCNRVLLTSVGLGLAASNLKGESVYTQSPSLAYPSLKIDGAERVMPGSFLYFSYPRANEPAVLVRDQDGEYLACSRKCAHLGCSVDFDSQRRCFKCPCRKGAYDARTGFVMYGPAAAAAGPDCAADARGQERATCMPSKSSISGTTIASTRCVCE